MIAAFNRKCENSQWEANNIFTKNNLPFKRKDRISSSQPEGDPQRILTLLDSVGSACN